MTRTLYWILFCGLPVFLMNSCGTTTTAINVSNRDVGAVKGNPLGTYSDYGHGIRCDETDGLCRIDIYTGGLGSCDGGALQYARPKLDEYMTQNGFTSYEIVRGNYSMTPLSKCELSVRFDR